MKRSPWLICALAVAALFLAAVVWVGFASKGSEEFYANKTSSAIEPLPVLSGSNDGKREHSPQEPELQTELERAVTEKTRGLIAKYRPLLAEYKRLQDGTRHLSATIRDARMIGTTKINDAGKLFNESWRPYFAQNATAISEMQSQCVRLLSAEVLLESLKSTAQTGDSNFGALMQDLLANTDYPELLETNLTKLAKDGAFNPPNLRQEDGNRTLPEMIKELQKVTPALDEERKRILAAGLPPEMHEYMTAQSKAFVLSSLIVHYDKSWNGKAKKVQAEILDTGLQIRNTLSRLPTTSETRVRLATEYQAMILDVQEQHDSREEKSPAIAR